MRPKSTITHTILAMMFMAGTSHGQGPSLIGCTPPPGVDPEDFVCLDDYATNVDLVFRALGEVNFFNSTGFYPFGSQPMAGVSHAGVSFRKPYGDRLGYEASGLFDVDGDGYNDWATTWYDAEPVRAVDGVPRVTSDAYVLPTIDALLSHSGFAQTAQVLATKSDWNKVGLTRVFSGRTNDQIGPDIWGHASNALFPHEIGTIRDIDGDGRDELLIAANTTDGLRGSVNVMSYSNLYNDPAAVPLDTTERWVCIMRIVGETNKSEFAYELEDAQSDFNNDGQMDIVAASTFWRVDGPRSQNGQSFTTGGGWIFLTPPKQVFIDIQNSTAWPLDSNRDDVKKPIVLTAETDYNLCVMQLGADGMPLDPFNEPADAAERVGTIGDIADAGDLDGDGETDFVVTANIDYVDTSGSQPETVRTTGLHFLLSNDGYDNAGLSLANQSSIVTGIVYNATTGFDEPAIDLNFDGAAIDPGVVSELVIHGDLTRSYGNNQRSYFGLVLDGLPADGSDKSDLMLVSYKRNSNGNVGNFGRIDVLLDGPSRFAPGGSLRTLIDNATQLPVTLFHDDTVLAPDHVITGPSLGLGNLTGVTLPGNFDGIGTNDCEIGLTTIKGYSLGNSDQSLISTVGIVSIPTDTTQVPVLLQAIQHETPTYNPTQTMVTGDPYGEHGAHQRGLKAQAAWDQDGDGKDDLLLHTAASSVPILEAPDPLAAPGTPLVLFVEGDPIYNGFRPYFAAGQGEGGGSTHVMLSPPDAPVVIGTFSRLGLPSMSYRVSVSLDRVSPEIDPAANLTSGTTFTRQYDHQVFVVELVDACDDATALATTTATAAALTSPGHRAPIRLVFDIPTIGTTAEMESRMLRIRTRWQDETTGQPLCIPLPRPRRFIPHDELNLGGG